MEDTAERKYDRKFYERQQDVSLNSARRVAPAIQEFLDAKSIVDVGCGVGGWLLAFKELGADRIQGYDGEWVREDMLRIPPECFQPHDLKEPVDVKDRFDLAISLEVAEHLPHENSQGFVNTLTQLADVVLFSAAVPNQEGRNHINEQWPAYWTERFSTLGYVPLDYLRFKFWNDEDVQWWYRQNFILYVRESALKDYPKLLELQLTYPSDPLPLIHPVLYCEKWDKYQRALRKIDKLTAPPPTIRSGFRELRKGIRNLFRRMIGKESR